MREETTEKEMTGKGEMTREKTEIEERTETGGTTGIDGMTGPGRMKESDGMSGKEEKNQSTSGLWTTHGPQSGLSQTWIYGPVSKKVPQMLRYLGQPLRLTEGAPCPGTIHLRTSEDGRVRSFF